MLEEMSCVPRCLEPSQSFLGCSGSQNQPHQLSAVLGYDTVKQGEMAPSRPVLTLLSSTLAPRASVPLVHSLDYP